MAGVLAIGFATGLLNTAVFHAISPAYDRDPAATANVGGISFGLGCLVVTVLVAGTFYAYTVTSILVLIAVIPGFFTIWYARSSFRRAGRSSSSPASRNYFAICAARARFCSRCCCSSSSATNGRSPGGCRSF